LLSELLAAFTNYEGKLRTNPKYYAILSALNDKMTQYFGLVRHGLAPH
jgi:hypothetical protein